MKHEPKHIYVRAGHRRSHWRQRTVALLTLAVVMGGLWLGFGKGDGSRRTKTLRIRFGDQVVAVGRVDRLKKSPARLSRWLKRVPTTRKKRGGSATVILKTDYARLRRAAKRALQQGGGELRTPLRPVSATVRLPILKQAFRNNCETAALSMLLMARNVRVSQSRLQGELPTSGPLDPRPGAGSGLPVWGDPQRGFVGRVNGGGLDGGYGVYDRPIRALARRRGVSLRSLSQTRPERIYRRLLSGHPIMVWVGLSDGPYQTWRTPDGSRITGNFGEHTVVLTGIQHGELQVNDPLKGQRTVWTRGHFEELWTRLGRRALST